MDPSNRYTFHKSERLCSRKIIGHLFEKGKSIKEPSFILIYEACNLESNFPAQTMFSVSKRLYKRAVDRNRVKRLMREAFRHEKHPIYEHLESLKTQYALMFLYTGKRLPNQPYVNEKIASLLKRLKQETNKPPVA